jgi:hypothetical protein
VSNRDPTIRDYFLKKPVDEIASSRSLLGGHANYVHIAVRKLASNIHAVVDTDTHQSDLGPKSTRAGADGTQARAWPSRS